MSSTRLLVLGAVRIFQPIHGYDVRRELLSWRVDKWANVAPGSIYNALKTLTKEKFLKGNYERLFDAARVRVRAWEKANIQ